ncbi:MAG: hypothetical protein ACHQO8_00935 [Vicinamibacterales bacterium]
MAHVIEPASSGRAKCRGCGDRIAAGDLRFGERLPNPFADDDAEMTHWFHLRCAAFRRPEPLIETLEGTAVEVADRDDLLREARLGVAHRRLPRVSATARASSGRATCRACREPIAKDAWRISLVFYEDGRFVPAGFVHVTCAASYFETTDVMSRVTHFSPALTDTDLAEIRALMQSSPPA